MEASDDGEGIVKGNRLVPVAAILLLALLAACGSSAATSTPTSNASSATGDTAGPELQAILATTQLRPGPQRVSFLLLTMDSFVTVPAANVSPVYLPDDGSPAQPGETKSARFHLWPYGVRASYVTELNFDRPGRWRLDISLEYGVGSARNVQLLLDVQERIGVPDIGELAPRSISMTVRDVSSLEELTSDFTPDPELYALSVDEAIASGKPLMVVFSTPAFCSSPTCGPQLDTVSAVKEKYKDQAHFIHVEVYDNPADIQGDLSNAKLSPAVVEWGLNSDPDWFNESWVFVVDREGRIAAKFEGYATAEELEAGLAPHLEATGTGTGES